MVSTLHDLPREGKLNTKGKLVLHPCVDDKSKLWRVLDHSTEKVNIMQNLELIDL